MQITVSGKQVDLSDALRTRVSDHLDVIASKYFDHALEAQVTFSRARSFFTCDINVHAGRGLTLRGEGEAADANTAFDDAAEHIAKRLRRYRRRVNEHARDIANRERPEAARQYTLRQEDDRRRHEAGTARRHATVIAEQATEISLLSVSEAVMRMDLADQPVLMFRNSHVRRAERGVPAQRRQHRLDRSGRTRSSRLRGRDEPDQCTCAGTISCWTIAATATSRPAGDRHRRAVGGVDRERRGPVDHHRLHIGDLLHAELRELLGRNVANIDDGGHGGPLVRLAECCWCSSSNSLLAADCRRSSGAFW